MNSPNKSPLSEYLDYYCGLNSPNFAVLIYGNWGIGKTYQVEEYFRIVEKIESNIDKKHIYISLYGLKSQEEVYTAIEAKIDPLFEKVSDLLDTAGKSKAGQGTVNIIATGARNFWSNALRNRINGRIIVFDDLERNTMGLDEQFGIFNSLLEDNCKLILISNKDELMKNQEDFGRVMEKVIGHSIEPEADKGQVYDSFCAKLKLPQEKKDFFKEHKLTILEIFRLSECNSLRILNYLILNVCRLIGVLETKVIENDDAMRELLSQFCSFDIEVRLNNLEISDLKDREFYELSKYARKENFNGPPYENLLKFDEKYKTVYLHNDLLGFPVWENIFKHAKFRKVEIMGALNKTVYFSDPKDLEPYDIIFHFSQYEESVFNEAVEKFEQQINKRVYTKPDLMLFVFSLQFMLSKLEVINKDSDTIERECIEYIDTIDFSKEYTVSELIRGIAYKEDFYKNYLYWGDSTLLDNIREHLTAKLNQTLNKKKQ